MLIVLSPAKTLDFTAPPSDLPASEPEARSDTATLMAVARKLKAEDLRRLMGVSDKLAALNVARFKAFKSGSGGQGVQAALAFAGDVYEGLNARSLDAASLTWAQDRLRILSGLYGVLRPLDRIQPYRLEMGVRLATKRGATLYDFWGERIVKTLNKAAAAETDRTLVNLASQEYFHAVDRKALKRPLVTCLFKQSHEGQVRHLALYAKTARGLMARYAIDERVERAETLKGFDRAGYRFRAEVSDTSTWVFVRPQPSSRS